MSVSIIVPIYNVQDYLSECISSITHQTYQNIQLILVDDGSTDASGVIARKAAEDDSRIQYIHQENAGQSAARNNGMQCATGDYITFVDSDDFLLPYAVERMVNLLEGNEADISVIGCAKLHMNGKYTGNARDDGILLRSGEQCADNLLEDNHFYTHAVWGKLYRRNILEGIESPVGLTAEDTYVSMVSALRSKKIVMEFGIPLYVYRMRPNSTCTSPMNIKSFDFFQIYEKCYDALAPFPNSRKKCERRIIRSYISLVGRSYAVTKEDRNPFAEKLSYMNRQVGKYFSLGLLSRTEIGSYFLARFFPHILGTTFKFRKNQNGIIDGSRDSENVISESFDELVSLVNTRMRKSI